MRTIIALAGLAAAAVVAVDFAKAYAASSKTGWARVWDGGRGSATIVWQQLGVVLGGLLAASDQAVDWLTQFLNAPGADDSIKNVLNQVVTPAKVGTALAIYALISIAARMRTLRKK